ncbi:MAG TPA: uroporphyrinogen-III C-methyltransferase [Rhodospirillales bacterium]|nr:uroporphyrinogen-III C-methyltransferase [Rhodospirillales bacterium]
MHNSPAALDMSIDPARMARVAIVGAGPGEADLLTLRAVTWLGRADVVVYDRLVGPGVLAHAQPEAHLIDVGKTPGGRGHSQAAIGALLVHYARAGRCVVRLKGGDPFIFGRGGEEIETLARHGIAVEVVPGITAALGCAAAAGIPLTQRGISRAVTFLTGATADSLVDLDWTALVRLGQTLVIYMGVAGADAIARRMIGAGLDPVTPAAVIENGTLPGQRIVTASVATLGETVENHAIQAPALLVIGEVARRAVDAATWASFGHRETA